MKYYAIKDETQNEIVTSWEECQEALKKYIKPKYKSFSSLDEAKAFIKGEVLDDGITMPKAYIDGSYNQTTKEYSFGGILIIDNKEYIFKKKYSSDIYSDLRNVAGEIKGAGFIINYCIKQGIKELHIFYDYLGIEKWYKEEWKANSSIAIEYQKFAKEAKNKINVIFHKVKSHTNNHYNEMADKLAKEAIGI